MTETRGAIPPLRCVSGRLRARLPLAVSRSYSVRSAAKPIMYCYLQVPVEARCQALHDAVQSLPVVPFRSFRHATKHERADAEWIRTKDTQSRSQIL